MKEYEKCLLCPRECGVDRRVGTGYCGMREELQLSRAALHLWEEPCISGDQHGSGAIFFTGCNMGCVFCQNAQISQTSKQISKQIPEQNPQRAYIQSSKHTRQISVERLAEIMLRLQEQGAYNINLVTPTHFVPSIVQAVRQARGAGLTLPIVYNTSAYEKVETLRMLEGIVDIYLPDFKFWEESTAIRYAGARHYPEYAKAAIAEMVRQTGAPQFSQQESKQHGQNSTLLMQRGVIVRHLLLPEHLLEAKKIVRYLYEQYENTIYYSLMSQYTPIREFEQMPELNHKVRRSNYNKLVDFAISLGITNAYIQEGSAAMQSFIPNFDCTGVSE